MDCMERVHQKTVKERQRRNSKKEMQNVGEVEQKLGAYKEDERGKKGSQQYCHETP